MHIVLSITLVLNALVELLAGASLILGPVGISAAGTGEMWSMHYGFAVLAIASISIWVWPQRYNRQVVTPALLSLIVFHVGLCCSLTLAGDQFVGSIIHGVFSFLFVLLFGMRGTFVSDVAQPESGSSHDA